MKLPRKKRKRHLQAVTELPLRQPDELRSALLHEWEILHQLTLRNDGQHWRYQELTAILWPTGGNPRSGIWRVRGGHGFPINTEPPA